MQTQSRTDVLWYLFASLILAALVVINLNLPFLADQGVVIAGAKAIARGDILYVDFWDNKMPGLFWFYWIAGELFSFDEIGIHLFESLWMLCFAVAMALGLRRELMFPWLSAVAPLAVIGIYYAAAGANHLTLPEGVVGFPLFLCALTSIRAGNSPNHAAKYFFASGLLAGISVVFKLIFAPICVAIWLVAFGFLWFREKCDLRWIISRAFLPVLAGVVIILGLVVIKFWADDALAELLWTAFAYPSEALAVSPSAGKQRLLVSSMFIITKYAVWLLPLLIAIVWWVKNSKDLFTTTMLAWLVVGVMVILIQRFSWWGYHFFLIFPPMGLLAIKGLDVIVGNIVEATASRFSPRFVSSLLAITLVLPIATIANEKAELALVSLWFEKNPPENYRAYIRRDYAVAQASTVFLKQKGALPGDIIVFGDPLYYHLGERHPAIPMVGWPWEYFLQSQWLELPRQIDESRPPYIFIADREKKMMERRKGGVQEFIFAHYVALHRAQQGTWFQIKRDFKKRD